MQRCPQCEFVYEDDERFCDMDGSVLVHEALSLPLPPLAEVTGEPQTAAATRSWRNLAIPAIGGVFLAALLFTGYQAATHGWFRREVSRPVANAQAASRSLPTFKPEPSPANEESPRAVDTPRDEAASEPPQARALGAPLSSGPVKAAGSNQHGRGPVFIHLTNGAVIKADEAWEKREGIWYRQAGVVTFLKRNRARAIERPASPRSATPSDRKASGAESTAPKKEGRVNSILKTTGRILRRPFKF
jgi:hypothetical protein